MDKSLSHEITLDESWLKAIVLGSLWASFEIIVGSFLHNLRMPFAGTLMSAFAIIFLISFYQIWPQKWLIMKAGIICALMKSISPSAVIFGPMIGILSEAFLVEIFIFLFGKNLFSYFIGGAFAVFSALLHKVINLIILYSFDLVKVYLNMVNFATNKLNIQNFAAIELLVLLSLLYMLTGGIAAILGYFSGKKAKLIIPKKNHYTLKDNSNKDLSNNQTYSVFLLATHIILLITGLWFLSLNNHLIIILVFISIYIFLCYFYYKNLARKLLKPLFWIQLLIILLLAALFLNKNGNEFSIKTAIISGLTMLFRAIFVITSFSAISREIINPSIRNYLLKKKKIFFKIYMALQIAFQTLPVMIENNNDLKSFLQKPFSSLSSLISEANNWLESLKFHQNNNM